MSHLEPGDPAGCRRAAGAAVAGLGGGDPAGPVAPQGRCLPGGGRRPAWCAARRRRPSLATSGLLDPASAMIVGEAAWTSLSLRRPRAGGAHGPAGPAAAPGHLVGRTRIGCPSTAALRPGPGRERPDRGAPRGAARPGGGGRAARRAGATGCSTTSRRPGTASRRRVGSTTTPSHRPGPPGAAPWCASSGSRARRPTPRRSSSTTPGPRACRWCARAPERPRGPLGAPVYDGPSPHRRTDERGAT